MQLSVKSESNDTCSSDILHKVLYCLPQSVTKCKKYNKNQPKLNPFCYLSPTLLVIKLSMTLIIKKNLNMAVHVKWRCAAQKENLTHEPKRAPGQNLSVDLVSFLGGLGGWMVERAFLAYREWCSPASHRDCSTRTLGSDIIYKIKKITTG